jgi:hypothetical protein
MFLNQLSVFLENREGRLDQVLETLKNNGINIVSLSLADTSDYGMLRMIVANPETAKAVLREAGFSAMLTPVMGVKLAHKAGSLQECLSELSKEGINIEYMYALATSGDDASIVIKTTDLEKAVAVLNAKGIALAATAEIEG